MCDHILQHVCWRRMGRNRWHSRLLKSKWYSVNIQKRRFREMQYELGTNALWTRSQGQEQLDSLEHPFHPNPLVEDKTWCDIPPSQFPRINSVCDLSCHRFLPILLQQTYCNMWSHMLHSLPSDNHNNGLLCCLNDVVDCERHDGKILCGIQDSLIMIELGRERHFISTSHLYLSLFHLPPFN